MATMRSIVILWLLIGIYITIYGYMLSSAAHREKIGRQTLLRQVWIFVNSVMLMPPLVLIGYLKLKGLIK